MRGAFALITGTILLSSVLAGCNGSSGDRTEARTQTPTPTLTAEQIFVVAQDLPGGCRPELEGSIFQGFSARSFDCGGVRLTTAVGALQSIDAARLWQSDNWSTRDGVTDLIKRSLQARPTDLNSLRVQDVTDAFPRLGADEEKLYCASFTDASGSQRVTEYWGGYRYKTAVVQYTASALTPGTCENASQLPEMARALATAQLTKLRAVIK